MTSVIAHRGASFDAPENTLAAFRLAWLQNADAVEMDLRSTRDGRLAVMHDDDLLRTTGARIRVRDLDSKELKSFDAGQWKGTSWSGECIPMLDEALALVPPGRRVLLELKEGPETLPELKRCLRHSSLSAEQVCVISFDQTLVAKSAKFLTEIEHAWVVGGPASETFSEILAGAVNAGLDALDLHASWPLDHMSVETVHQAGLKLYVWTVDDVDDALHFAGLGVDGITTNKPGLLRRTLSCNV